MTHDSIHDMRDPSPDEHNVVYRGTTSSSPACSEVLQCMRDMQTTKHTENVCRISTTSRVFDWTLPPNKSKGSAGTGTGFILKESSHVYAPSATEVLILTAKHVVEHHVHIGVNFQRVNAHYYTAELVGCNSEMDVALLSVRDPEFCKLVIEKDIQGIPMGDSDYPAVDTPMSVMAHGFALGKPHLQTVKGVVSGRIDCPSRLQTDVSVNPGNSGGPLVDSDQQVIGVVTSGMSQYKGINYVAPIRETLIITNRILKLRETAAAPGKTLEDCLPCVNASFSKGNRILMPNQTGILCNAVHPDVASEDGLQVGDVVTGIQAVIDGADTPWYTIDLQMSCQYPFWKDRIGFAAIFDRLCCGDRVKMKVTRNGADEEVVLTLRENLNTYRKMYADTADIPYAMVAGVVLMPLLHNHIPLFRREPLYTLMSRPASRHRSLIFVSHILAESPFTRETQTIGAGDVLTAIDNFEINTMQDVYDALRNLTEDDKVTLRMRDGSMGTASVLDMRRCEANIAKTHGKGYVGDWEPELMPPENPMHDHREHHRGDSVD